ncbi:24278_t:CDS:2, partial [Entrophospora sp. SA101]
MESQHIPKWKKFLVLKEDSNKDDKSDITKPSSINQVEIHNQDNKKIKSKSKKDKDNKKIKLEYESKIKKIPEELSSNGKLVQWKYHTKDWKFQKIRQIWLLTNVYNINMFPDELFEIFLDYLIDLKGLARE